MNKLWLFFSVIIISLVITPSCRSAWVWNPVGSWELMIVHSGWGDITETIELTGDDSGGTLTGWERGNQQSTTGTWIKTGDFSIEINIDYWVAPNNTGAQHTVKLTGNSSESSPNSMSGDGTWQYQAFFNIYTV